jgi:hypothetical protein
MTGPHWKLEDDYKTITVTFPTDPVAVLKLDVTEVDKMIEMLGMMRSSMQPEVPKDFPFGQKVSAVPDPHWRSEPDLLRGHSLLHLRHPGFGWLHYLMPPQEAKRLAEILQAQAETQPQSLQPGKTN